METFENGALSYQGGQRKRRPSKTPAKTHRQKRINDRAELA